MKSTGNNGMPTDVTEYFKLIAEARRQAKKTEPIEENELGLVDPIICNGVADIIVTKPEEEKEM